MNFFLILCLYLTTTIDAKNCQSGINFLLQPPQVLNCIPTGLYVALYCYTSPSESFEWYHTLDSTKAGITGELIVNDGNPYYLDSVLGYNSQLSFTVSNNTIGFYWCVITSNNPVSLRPSTVTPICLNYDNSLPPCPRAFSLHDQHHNVTECADANVTFDRVALPTNCILTPSTSPVQNIDTTITDNDLQIIGTTITDYDNENQTLLYILFGVCVFLFILSIILIAVIFILCLITKRH